MSKKVTETIYKTINDRVKLFLNTKTDTDVVESWDEEDNQSTFKQLIKNLIKKNDNSLKNKNKPENTPKRPNSIYICFCASEMSNFKEKNPDLDNRQIMSALAAEWKKINKDESKIHRFKEMAILDKERYQKEMSEFKKENQDAGKSQQVKKPKSNYLFFCEENRAKVVSENPDLNPKQVMSALGDAWKTVKSEGGDRLKHYDDLATKDKERYLQQKEDSKGDESEEVVEKPKKKVAKAKKEKVDDGKKKETKSKKKVVEDVVEDEEEDVVEEKPKKKTKAKTEKKQVESSDTESKPKKLNGYIKFLNANREGYKAGNPSLSSKAITQELALQWKALSEEEKQTWKES
jgi:upstream-binding transcription factor